MTITVQTRAYTDTITLEGRLDAIGATELEKHFQQINPITKVVIIDMAKLSYISSMGLRAILQAYKTLAKYHKKLNIVNIPPNIRQIFEMSGFIQAFVHEEKFVIIEKEQSDLNCIYSVAGILDIETIGSLEALTRKVRDEKITNINILCEGLKSISFVGCEALKNLRDMLSTRNGFLTMENIPQPVLEEIKKIGCDDFIKSVAIQTKKNTDTAGNDGLEIEQYVFTGAWGSFELPKFDAAWKQMHKLTQTVVIDVKGVSGLNQEAFASLMALKESGTKQNITVDLSM
ncbi:MAG: STAS domain-containing protein [Spirochaetaceae bacterium]|jgi:anti-anti-sigma factor|nr:STAS domain-containing protein [Spirochaetaceae bacterium]